MDKEFNPAEYGATEVKKSFNPQDYGAEEVNQASNSFNPFSLKDKLSALPQLQSYQPNQEQTQKRQLSPDAFTPDWQKNVSGFDPRLAQSLISVGAGALANSAVPGSGLLASLGRIGAGTGASTAIDALNPDNNLTAEVKKNAFINSLMEGLPAGAKGIGKVLSKVQPGKYGREFIEKLSNGLSVDKSNQSAASDIKKLIKNKIDEASEKYYDPIENKVGNEVIYDNKNISRLNVSDEVKREMGPRLRDLYHDFSQDPTYTRAHKIQSELGKKGYKLKHSDLPSDNKTGEELLAVKDKLVDHIKSFLDLKDTDLLNKYNEGTKFYSKEVIPYLKDKTFSKVYYGEDLTPNTIANKFSKTTADDAPLVKKAAQDLGNDFIRKILHTRLGKNSLKQNPSNLANAIQKLKETGFERYITPDIEEAHSELTKRLLLNKLAKYGAGGAGAALSAGGIVKGLLSNNKL